MPSRVASIAATVGIVGALAALPGTSNAGHQPAKNGCTSTGVPSGTLTSPVFTPDVNSIQPELVFQRWFEVESVAPEQLRVDLTNNNGSSWIELANLTPTAPAGARADLPLSNSGFGQTPRFAAQTIDLGNFNGQQVRVRFRFVAGDRLRQGFRGWGIDNIELRGSNTALWTFDTGLEGWSVSGLWRRQPNPQSISVAPGINPELVTLPSGDSGALPASSAAYVWFGDPATGTYCDAAAIAEPPPPNLAPVAAFNVNPPTAQTGETVSFDGTPSSDPEGALASHTWDFGDGSPLATGPTASHVYRRKGTYTVSLTVTDVYGASSVASYALEVDTNLPDGILVANSLDELPNPRAYREVNIQPTGGDVFIRLPRRRGSAAQADGAPRGFIPLTQSARLPIGSIVETSRGKVMLESARDTRRRRTQTAEFFNGRFSMRQPRARRPFTELILKGGTFRGCPSTRSAKGSTGAEESQRRRTRRSRVRRLWGNGRGRFRTRGRYSSATVRGTKWLVEDRCGETLTRVARRPRNSVVLVRDLGRRRTVRLTAGRRYVARPRGTRR